MEMLSYQTIQIETDPVTANLVTQMDPKLQQAILLRRNGSRKLMTVSVSEDEIAVLAKVKSVNDWKECTDVRGSVFITKSADGNYDLVTGRIPISRAELVRNLPFVKSLKAARRLTAQLSKTLTAIEKPVKTVAGKSMHSGGKGVIVGIIDTGCDFAHENFMLNGKTRIRSLWDQSFPGILPDGRPGKIYSATDINKALKTADPYKALGYNPGDASHGTHVMDIAAGNGNGTGMPGVAPDADIIFVHVSAHDIAWQGKEVINNNFGDSVNLVEAITYIFNEAGDQPCVVNISLGTNGGPHDGTTIVEESIDGLLGEKGNRAVVIAASNSYEHGIHAMGEINPRSSADLNWIVQAGDKTENELEIWYPGRDRISIEIIDPSGKSLGTTVPGEAGTIKDADGNDQLVIVNRTGEPNNGDNNIGVWMREKQTGTWRIRLKNMGIKKASYHAWIERDDFGQSCFGNEKDSRYTLGSISCSKKTITVGSYDATITSKAISPFSSSGPTRDEREKPEISAPGSKIIAARSGIRNGNTAKSGTSMASPVISGSIALLLEAAVNKKAKLNIDEIRSIITLSGLKDPPAKTWDSRYGFGRISVGLMLKELDKMVKTTETATPVKKKASKKKAAKKRK